jgi:hypothetical protein
MCVQMHSPSTISTDGAQRHVPEPTGYTCMCLSSAGVTCGRVGDACGKRNTPKWILALGNVEAIRCLASD